MSDGLPKGWRRVSLSEVASACLGKMLDRQKHTKGLSLPYLRNQNVRWFDVDTADVLSMFFEPRELSRFGLVAGDVLVCEGGEPGRAAIWDGRSPQMLFQKALHRIRPSSSLLPEWLVFRLWHDAQAGRLEEYFTGTTIKHLTGTSLAKYKLPLPPLNEQRRIVGKLESLQAKSRRARSALEAVPPLLEKLRQSILAAAFRGDLTKDWRAKHPDVEPASELLKRIRVERRRKWEEAELAKMTAKGKAPKDDTWKLKYKEPAPVDLSGLPELPGGWVWGSLDEVTTRITKGSSPNWQGFDYVPVGIPFVRSQNVGWGLLDLSDVACLPVAFNLKEPRSILHLGDVLLNIVGASIGRATVATAAVDGGNTNQAVAVIRLTERRMNWYTMRWLLSPTAQRRIHSDKVDVARANLSLDDVGRTPIPIPPLDEILVVDETLQVALARQQGQSALLAKCLERNEELGRSVLAKAFRGELVQTAMDLEGRSE